MSHKYDPEDLKDLTPEELAEYRANEKAMGRYANSQYFQNMRAQKQTHQETFKKAAKICGLCGYPMDYQGHALTDWEQKWSVHEPCRDKAHRMLDRNTGIARERRAIEQQIERRKKRRGY